MRPLNELLRPNIARLAPYSCARNEYSGGEAHVFLDANENPYNTPYNRYPDPLQTNVKAVLSKIKGVRPEQICLGNGSDELIDLVYRCFCRPRIDNVVAIEPTYGMYHVCADINDVEYRAVTLDEKFQINAEKLLKTCDRNTKAIWLCTPNNPTGNTLSHDEIVKIITAFDGIVVIDEAYSDFSRQPIFRTEINRYPNIIVLNTMSKAWGCAAIRLGMAFAQKAIIDVFNNVKYPYNVNLLTQDYALKILKDPFEVEKWVNTILLERNRLMSAFALLPFCEQIFPTDANFFLVRVNDAQAIYDYLVARGIIVRNRTKVTLCHDCLRITTGSKSENNELLATLRQYRC